MLQFYVTSLFEFQNPPAKFSSEKNFIKIKIDLFLEFDLKLINSRSFSGKN